MAVNPYELYKQQEVLSANRGELLLMLYNNCIKQMKLARLHLADRNLQGAHQSLVKAQDVITELCTDLDMQYEISGKLLQLYRYFHGQLVQANIKKDAAAIEPVLAMMSELRDVWQQAAHQAPRAHQED